jgi:hypothetical protein
MAPKRRADDVRDVLLSKIDGDMIIIQAIDREFMERHPTRKAEYEYLDEAGREVSGILFAKEHPNFVVVIESRVVGAGKGSAKGLGTRMYELAAKLSCSHFGKPLASDEMRSGSSEGFWVKQVREGRAVCVEATGTTPDLSDVDPEDRVMGRGGCVRYVMSCAPKKATQLNREINEALAMHPTRSKKHR